MPTYTKNRLVAQPWHDTRRYILSTMPVLWISMRKDGDTFTSDDAYGHLCTVTGTTWGRQGRNFTGDDLISMPNAAVLHSAAPFSIGAWVREAGVQSSANCAIINDYDGNYKGYLLAVGTDGKPTFRVGRLSDTQLKQVIATQALADNTWTYVVGVYDGTKPMIYVDTVVTSGGTFASIEAETGTTTIGKANWSATYFVGDIGEVWKVNRALSLAEIQKLRVVTRWRY